MLKRDLLGWIEEFQRIFTGIKKKPKLTTNPNDLKCSFNVQVPSHYKLLHQDKIP